MKNLEAVTEWHRHPAGVELTHHRQDACVTLAFGLLLLVAWGPSAHANPGHEVMRQGVEAYDAGDLETAVGAFREALGHAEEDETLDPATARLNLGTALARGGQFEDAAAELDEALKTDDLNLQAQAQYNLGHVRYQEAESLVEQQDLQNAKSKIEQSIGHFQDALRLNPGDVPTKKNFELSHLKKKEIETLIEEQPPQEQPQQGDDEDQESDENQDQQDQEQDQNQDQQDSQQDQQQNQEQPPEQPEEDPANQDQEQNQDSGEEDQEDEQPAPQPAPEQMTEEEAEMLLEAMKEEEQKQREQYRIRLGRPQPVDKDW